MTILNDDELATIVGSENVEAWKQVEYKVYYKDSKPYGLMYFGGDDDLVVSTGCAIDNRFTIHMIADIIKVYRDSDIMLITDEPSAFGKMQQVLSRYGFKFKFTDDGKMLSLHTKE
jgi:hypothetical protein